MIKKLFLFTFLWGIYGFAVQNNTFAQQSQANVSVKIQNQKAAVMVTTDNSSHAISGVEICLKYDPQTTITTVEKPQDQNGNTSKFTEILNKIDATNKSACFTYVSITSSIDLPKTVTIPIVYSATSGNPTFTITRAKIVGNIPGDSYTVNIDNAKVDSNTTTTNTQNSQSKKHLDFQSQNKPEGFISKIIRWFRGLFGQR